MKMKGKSKDPKRAEADTKRISSMIEMKKRFKDQKFSIKEALASVDYKPKNKIVFDEETSVSSVTPHDTNNKKALFDDDDIQGENIDYNFEVKKQFEGKKGQKLLELQSKFKKDKRFAMDERFLEDEEIDENEQVSQEDEQKKQFEILEEVLGRKVAAYSTSESQKRKCMLRFDPTQPEHSKFEVQEVVHDKKKKKQRDRLTANDDVDIPAVSNETFYQVNEGLKETLQQKQAFSLLSMFGQREESEESREKENGVEESISKNKSTNANPFKYDSSTDEEEEEAAKDANENVTKTAAKPTIAPSRLWTESFFFKPDDYRLQEGRDFMKKLGGEEVSGFVKLRRDLRKIVRAKVRNNQRKDKPFKKKLGGRKKMLRVKKAMKR